LSAKRQARTAAAAAKQKPLLLAKKLHSKMRRSEVQLCGRKAQKRKRQGEGLGPGRREGRGKGRMVGCTEVIIGLHAHVTVRLLQSRSMAMRWRALNVLLSTVFRETPSGSVRDSSCARSSFVIISQSEITSGSGELRVTTMD